MKKFMQLNINTNNFDLYDVNLIENYEVHHLGISGYPGAKLLLNETPIILSHLGVFELDVEKYPIKLTSLIMPKGLIPNQTILIDLVYSDKEEE